jgi:asparagine synthase (glutamine-hydrolysing)
VNRDNFHLWAEESCPTIIGGHAAAVGRLIERSTGIIQHSLPAALPSEEDFVRRFWGGYILFTRNSDQLWRVLREPSGTLPVYYEDGEEGRIYASDADTLRFGGSEQWRPDLDFVRHSLSFPFLRTARTGVAGVSELLPGTSVGAKGARTVWQPWQHVSPAPSPVGFEEAAARLRETALETIPLLVPDGIDPVVQLSGGLDSSIIGGVLAHAGRRFRAVTFATRAPGGDERRYARAAANAFGAELVEVVEEESPPAFDVNDSITLRPRANPLLQPYHSAFAHHLSASGAKLVLSGGGGDNVFAYLLTASPAVDALRMLGPMSAATVIGHIAEVHGCTWWRAAAATIRKARRSPSPWRRETVFVRTEDALEQVDTHPWLSSPLVGLPGKEEHLASIVGIHHFLDLGPSGPPFLFPLLAQPLLETCLGVPSWLWVKGGRDRAVAREAFKGIVPELILARRSKGRLDSMLMRQYLAARPQLEELLLDGLLASHAFIDVEAIQTYTRACEAPKDALYVRLLEIAAIELWLRSFG